VEENLESIRTFQNIAQSQEVQNSEQFHKYSTHEMGLLIAVYAIGDTQQFTLS
jgi:hypothetical protein